MKKLILCIILASSCLAQGVRDRVLLPSIQQAWVGVREDVVYGGGMLDSELAQWDAAVETGNFIALDIQDLEMQAQAGIDQQLQDGVVGPQGAVILKERAAAFAASVKEYMRSSIAMIRRPAIRQPLVITRSSWATNPPPTLVPAIRGY